MVSYLRKHHRQSTRLKGYDYGRPGAYFITANCINREPLFGEIVNGKMALNNYGEIAHAEWYRTPTIRPNIMLGAFVVMPDHIHGIIIIKERDSRKISSIGSGRGVLHPPLPDPIHCNPPRPGQILCNPSRFGTLPCNPPRPDPSPQLLSPSGTLGAIMRGYMGAVTSQINKLRDTPDAKVWQKNYNDRIIRTPKAFEIITTYIHNNPKNWERKTKM